MLREADFRGAIVVGANFVGSDFTGALFSRTTIARSNLRQAIGLESCRYEGPSSVDFTSLALSWPLPIPFLRGCGLADALIKYLPSLLDQPIQFFSCFVSYSTKDQEFAERLHGDLQNKGVRCWFAPHDIKAGAKMYDQIDEAILLYDRLLLILSEHSMNSEWVKTEIARARQKELNEGRQVLFPISLVPFDKMRDWKCFDADAGKDSAREIREYFIPDFNNWKDHDSYRQTLERLVKDLKAEEKHPKR